MFYEQSECRLGDGSLSAYRDTLQWRICTNSEHFLNPGKFLLLIFNKYFHTERVTSHCSPRLKRYLNQIGSAGPDQLIRS